MQTILIVDDEERMLDLVELFLIPHGYTDLVLLDVMMPEMDGWDVCESIREFSKVPIIMLTARADKSDLAKGLLLGADDYISKPFDERELIARINAVLRRIVGFEKDNENITFKDFVLDKETYSLHYQNSSVQLTLKEFLIIKALISRPSKTFTREELLHAAWEYETDTDTRTVDSHIRNLREKLSKSDFPTDEFLKTVWGIGYKWS